jgi:phage tail-like protein
MRGSVPGLRTPYPIAEMLPAYLQQDPFAVRWVGGFDDVLAPVVSVLDCIEAYVDPRLAPDDFPDWLAGWVGALIDENWTDDRRRRAVADSVRLHRDRGTVAGLCAQLELASGGRVEITGGGAVTWSRDPDSGFPAEIDSWLWIRVYVEDPSTVSVPALNSIVDAAKPAHLPHSIEVTVDDRLS